MKTTAYNPSQLEVEFAYAIEQLRDQMEAHLTNSKIVHIEDRIKEDNPMLVVQVEDSDQDIHEIVIKIIQRPDH